MEIATLKVRSDTNVKKLAGSISYNLKGNEDTPARSVELLAIGAGACSQAVKAIAISSGHLGNYAQTVTTRIGFRTSDINGEKRTVMCFIVEVN